MCPFSYFLNCLNAIAVTICVCLGKPLQVALDGQQLRRALQDAQQRLQHEEQAPHGAGKAPEVRALERQAYQRDVLLGKDKTRKITS